MPMPDSPHHHANDAPPGDVSQVARTSWIVRILMLALLGVGAYYVIAEHGAHLLGAWPLLILLACLPMHMFHGGHGGHGGHRQPDDKSNTGGRND